MWIDGLPLEKAILLKDMLMRELQSSPEESRPDIQELLEDVDLYLAIKLRRMA